MKTFLFLLSPFVIYTAHAAGFDCTKAGSENERAICADANLSQLDDKMTAAYYQVVKMIGTAGPRYQAFRKNQQEWVKERGRCGDTKKCLEEIYRQRIEWLSAPLHIASGEYANKRFSIVLFHDGDSRRPLVRVYAAPKPSDQGFMAMEMQSRWVDAENNKIDGEDAVHVTPSFVAPYRQKYEGSCSALRLNFNIMDKLTAGTNDGCPLFKGEDGEFSLRKPLYHSPSSPR